nr:hypothetical protein Iba_chr11eCG5340 [Ipomoea batatas]
MLPPLIFRANNGPDLRSRSVTWSWFATAASSDQNHRRLLLDRYRKRHSRETSPLPRRMSIFRCRRDRKADPNPSPPYQSSPDARTALTSTFHSSPAPSRRSHTVLHPSSSAQFHKTQSGYAEVDSGAEKFVNHNLVGIENNADIIVLSAGEKGGEIGIFNARQGIQIS